MSDVQKPERVTALSLDSLIATGGAADRKISVLVGHNLGSNTLLMRLPLHEFYEISEVANAQNIAKREGATTEEVAQRNLDPKHATKLAIYILKGVVNALVTRYLRNGHPSPAILDQIQRKLGRQPYLAMQPVTANIRSCATGGGGLRFEEEGGGLVSVHLSSRDVLWIVDGQHRRMAVQMLFDFFKTLFNTRRYPGRPLIYPVTDGSKVTDDEYRIWNELYDVARSTCTIMVEAHLGLKPDQERQLFHDLNNMTKKVESSLAFQFDHSNPVNLWIKENLIDNEVLRAPVVQRDQIDWSDDTGAIARKDLIGVCAILFLNRTNVRNATPQAVMTRDTFAQKFWEAVNKIPCWGEPGCKMKTVAAQPVILKALAKLAYDFGFGKHQNEAHLRKLFEGIPKLPFAHTEPMWRFYQLTPNDRKKLKVDSLADYLPPNGPSNRDVGMYNEKEHVMRFSIRHNDVFPILGDMIRWKLGLPPRNKLPEEKKQLALATG